MILFYKSTCVEYCVESCVESCLNLVWILFESCFESCVESCLNLVLNIVFNLWWIILRKNKYTQNSEGLPQFRKNYFGLYYCFVVYFDVNLCFLITNDLHVPHLNTELLYLDSVFLVNCLFVLSELQVFWSWEAKIFVHNSGGSWFLDETQLIVWLLIDSIIVFELN